MIPTACFEYDIIWSHLLPLGAALYLLESRFSKMLTAGTATLVAFGIGAMGTVLGTVAAWVVVGKQIPIFPSIRNLNIPSANPSYSR